RVGCCEVDDRVEVVQMLRREPCGIRVVCRLDVPDTMTASAPDLRDERPRLTLSQHEQIERAGTQSNTSGSTSAKNLACRRRTASGTSASSTTKVRLISDAPWEIMRTFMSRMASKTCAATPAVSRMFSPTRQTMALRPEYFTKASGSRSAAICGMASLESTVSEMLTSE